MLAVRSSGTSIPTITTDSHKLCNKENPQYIMVNDAEARRLATRAEQDLNTYQAKQGLGPQSDSGM